MLKWVGNGRVASSHRLCYAFVRFSTGFVHRDSYSRPACEIEKARRTMEEGSKEVRPGAEQLQKLRGKVSENGEKGDGAGEK